MTLIVLYRWDYYLVSEGSEPSGSIIISKGTYDDLLDEYLELKHG